MAKFRSSRSGYKQYNSGSGWKYTHRTVASKKLGGAIFPGYQVHHINGNKTDNRPSNLTVLSAKAHSKIHNK
ncbi:MAG: HNH endonuclease signature motif containing protein [Candidatus Cloacimonadales bacterium]